MSAARWLFLGIVLPCMLFLLSVGFIGIVRSMREQPQIAKESGWKRIGWGLYLTGPMGGPYRGPPDDAADSGDRQRRRVLRLLLALAVAELFATGGGAWLAYALSESLAVAALVGLLVVPIVVGLIWIVFGGSSLWRELTLRRRG